MSESKLLLALLIKTIESQVSQIMLKSYDEGRLEGIQIGITTERDRLIELLEDYQQQALVSNIVYLGLERAIKIIKGEIK